MKTITTPRIILFLVSLSLGLLLVFSVLFVRLELSRRQSGMEYQVFRIMTGIVDLYNTGVPFDPASWPEVSGFGIYSPTGMSLYRYGSAPEIIEDRELVPLAGLSAISGSSMTMIRRIGSIAPMQEMNGRQRRMNSMGPMNPPGGMRGMTNGRESNRYVFIDINVASLIQEGRLVLLVVLAAFAFFFCIVSLVFVFYRKLEKYRIRERETAHLVQLGEAARTLAHEIKNPLGVIRVQCATLRRTIPEERRGNIEIIEEETARLVLLADRVRDFLHTAGGSPRECDASSFLERCASRYADRITVVPWSGPDIKVFVDPDRMMQVLDNLLVNALEASGKAPSIPELALSAHRNGVSFIVADSGEGVAPEDRDRLFEPFFTTKARGSGIGLALARRFAEQAGGSLAYSPRDEGGSVFTLNIPIRRDEKDGR